MTLQELIDRTHKRGVAIKSKIAELGKTLKGLEVLNRLRWSEKRKRERENREALERFTMYDSTEVSTIPHLAKAVAGYVGGHWPTYPSLVQKFPHSKRLSIAIDAREDADCLDVEEFDARPADVPNWVRRQKARGVPRPCIYANLSTMPAVKAELARSKIKRHEVRLWVAHYTYTSHIEPGYDATQWTDKALGHNLDASLCEPSFLP